jgi:MFS superfamily sulfate permease-like transporter
VQPPGILPARVDGPLFYANAVNVKERLLELARAQVPPPRAVVLELGESPDLDVETLDALADLTRTLTAEGIELRLASVRAPALALLERSGLAARVRIAPRVDSAVHD